MIRICNSLHEAGYEVLLIGRQRPSSKALPERPFLQRRIRQRIDQGKLFYLSYNLKLFFILLFQRADCFCAIDLDTILAVYYASRLRRMKRVYDAHELFTEMEEVVARPRIRELWLRIERHTVPHFPLGYTVNESLAEAYRQRYGLHYAVVRNATVLQPLQIPDKPERYILYQGAVNQGRCFPELIAAMQQVNARLIICGEGNFYAAAQALVQQAGLGEKVLFKGYVPPEELRRYTLGAYIGITLFVASSESNKLSLANRYFDYMHAGVPQLAMNYPEYAAINRQFEVAYLLDDARPAEIAGALNSLLQDEALYRRLQGACLKAREVYCWQQEAEQMLRIYEQVFSE
ncbi:MAG: glycosyltransferase family 4 protein [Bacteroidetes bacterium]|nr:glycosyltransferase family 4 protein [Bacteroidota bacterium]MBS1628720.1 glycosyltransferase family 4 protein [Bacteroidota bacterium]